MVVKDKKKKKKRERIVLRYLEKPNKHAHFKILKGTVYHFGI